MAGNDLRLLIRVEPNAKNRQLAWAVESDDYYRSGQEQMDGADAPRSRFVNLKQLPAGRYVVGVWVFDADAKRIGMASGDACFTGMTVSCAE